MRAFLAVALNGCVVVHHVADEVRDTGPFDAVSSEGSIDVSITPTAAHSVTVTCDVDQLHQVYTEVLGGELVIDTVGEGPFESWRTCVVAVGTPDLLSLTSSGSGTVEADASGLGLGSVVATGSGDVLAVGIETSSFAAVATGSGDLELEGGATQGSFDASGSGDIEAFDLVVGTADIFASGSGDVEVTATGTATVVLTGSGDVVVAGGASVEADDRGSGDVVVQ